MSYFFTNSNFLFFLRLGILCNKVTLFIWSFSLQMVWGKKLNYTTISSPNNTKEVIVFITCYQVNFAKRVSCARKYVFLDVECTCKCKVLQQVYYLDFMI